MGSVAIQRAAAASRGSDDITHPWSTFCPEGGPTIANFDYMQAQVEVNTNMRVAKVPNGS